MPIAFKFFVTVLDAEALLSIDDALRTVVRIMVAFGLCYQLPVVVWFLARLGLVDHRDLIKGFRYAVVVIFVIAALRHPRRDCSFARDTGNRTLRCRCHCCVFSTKKVREEN